MLHLLLFLNLLAWRGRTVQCSPLPVADAARVKVSCLRTDNSRGLARSSAAVIKVGHELQLLFEEILADAMAQQVNCSQGVHPSTHTQTVCLHHHQGELLHRFTTRPVFRVYPQIFLSSDTGHSAMARSENIRDPQHYWRKSVFL